jgi:hypothetical protein
MEPLLGKEIKKEEICRRMAIRRIIEINEKRIQENVRKR